MYISKELRTGILWIVSAIGLCACSPGVSYSGKQYISEGQPMNISCIRSVYGAAKWYKNGQIIDASSTNYSIAVQNLSLTVLRMELSVEESEWTHRGLYKCDSLSEKSHRIEIVPSIETDKKLRVQEPGHQSMVHLEPGSTIQLYCDKEEHDAFPINWYKDGRRLQDVEEKIRIDGRRVTIFEASQEDAGDYVCTFEEKGQSYLYADNQGSRTWVTSGAQVTDFPFQMRPIFSRNFSLECKVHGFPTPRINWFIDGVEYKNVTEDIMNTYQILDREDGLPNAIFFIPNVTYDNNHNVMCVAENVDGIDQTVTKLSVRENAIYTNEDPQGGGIILSPYTDLVLNCTYSDDPNAIFTWLKNNEPVDTGPESRIHLEPPTNNVLKIEHALETDCGNYTCMTRNIRATIAVRSVVTLAKLENSRNVVQGQNIVLTCNVTHGYPPPTLKWYKDEHEINASDPRITIKADLRGIEGSELHIDDANFDDRAEYTCIANNEFSSANATILVRVKDKYAALWPFLGICAEVAVLCTIIFIYEKRRQKPDFDDAETDHNTENKAVHDAEGKSGEVRQRK